MYSSHTNCDQEPAEIRDEKNRSIKRIYPKRRYLVVLGWDGKMEEHYMLIKMLFSTGGFFNAGLSKFHAKSIEKFGHARHPLYSGVG